MRCWSYWLTTALDFMTSSERRAQIRLTSSISSFELFMTEIAVSWPESTVCMTLNWSPSFPTLIVTSPSQLICEMDIMSELPLENLHWRGETDMERSYVKKGATTQFWYEFLQLRSFKKTTRLQLLACIDAADAMTVPHSLRWSMCHRSWGKNRKMESDLPPKLSDVLGVRKTLLNWTDICLVLSSFLLLGPGYFSVFFHSK